MVLLGPSEAEGRLEEMTSKFPSNLVWKRNTPKVGTTVLYFILWDNRDVNQFIYEVSKVPKRTGALLLKFKL